MKNISLILNGVLIIAVAVLFYLHFSTTSKLQAALNSSDSTKVALPEIRSVNGGIGYINYDSLTEKYEFYKQGVKDFTALYNRKQEEFAKKKYDFQMAVQTYQQIGASLSPENQQKREQELKNQEQQLMELNEKLTNDLAKREEDFNKKFLKGIDDYLKKLSKEKNYSYVFTYSKGGPATIVFANDSLEITNEVINGLNQAYKEKK